MKFPISSHIDAVPFPPISEVQGWIAGRSFSPERPLVDLCQAVPDYAPAPELVEHLKGVLVDPRTARYTPDEGLPEVRAAIAAWYRRRYGAGPQPGQICLTVGASQAFWLALMVLCREGDEVIVQQPAYFDHPMAIAACGVRCVYAPMDLTAGAFDLQALAALITPRTRALLLVTPSNPTGTILSKAHLRSLLDFARSHNIALLLDETYNAFLPGGVPPHELFADAAWPDHLVHLASFGKTFALTGFRAGALVASEGFLHQALKVQDTMAVCQPRITQEAVRFGCEHLDPWVAANGAMMQRRQDLFRAEFIRPGNPFTLAASGAFFAWVRHPFTGRSGRQVARMLAEEAHLICLPGEVFGPALDGFLRLAFGNVREEMIPAAVQRLREVHVPCRAGSDRSV
jgi:aspartate/methionine/tyrosine aminotransferase